MSTKIKQELPKWFKGQVYEEGAVVQNPFSGEECKLNNVELSMYDFIMGAQMCFDMGMQDDKVLEEFHKGLTLI